MSAKIQAVETSPQLSRSLITEMTITHNTNRPRIWTDEVALPKTFIKPKIDRLDFSKSRKKLRLNDTIAAFIAVATILFTYIEYEMYYENDYESTWGTDFLRSLNFILSMVIIGFVIRHYYIILAFLKLRDLIYPGTQLCQAEGVRKNMFREILLICIISPPGLDITYTFEQLDGEIIYSLDTLITLIYLFRFYFVLKLFKHYSQWTDQAAVNIGQRRNVVVNEVWALKCELRSNAITGLTIMLIFSIFVFGLALRTTEQPWPGSSFKFMANGWWIIAVSMTTIGYGEIVPVTHLGRGVTTAACIWGAFLLSAFVVVLIDGAVLEENEGVVFEKFSERIYVKSKLKIFAIKYIQRRIRLFLARKNKTRFSILDRVQLTARTHLSAFRFKKARKQHMVQEEETVEEITVRMAAKQPELTAVAEELAVLNPKEKVLEYKQSTNEFREQAVSTKNIYTEIEISTIRMYSVFRLLHNGSANRISDIADIPIVEKRETMPRAANLRTMGRSSTMAIRRSSILPVRRSTQPGRRSSTIARRKTSLDRKSSASTIKSLADNMENKKGRKSSYDSKNKQDPNVSKKDDVSIQDLND